MRENNSSLLWVNKTLPEPHCSVLVLPRRQGEADNFQRKGPQRAKGLRSMQIENTTGRTSRLVDLMTVIVSRDGIKCERSFEKLRTSSSEPVTGISVLAHKEDLSDIQS